MRWQTIGTDDVDVVIGDVDAVTFAARRMLQVAATPTQTTPRGAVGTVTVDDVAVHLRLRLR